MAVFLKIFKPQEDEIDFNSFVQFSHFFFKLVFFDFRPINDNASCCEKFVHLLKEIYFRLWSLASCLATISFITFFVVSLDDFVVASASIPNIVTVVMIGLKSVISNSRKADIWQIEEELKVFFDRRVGENAKYKIKRYIVGYHKIMIVYGAIILSVLLPIFVPVFDYIFNGAMDLPVKYWFPFDAYRPTTFPFSLMWMEFIAWNCCVSLLACDSLLYALITIIAMEFDILKDDLLNMKFPPRHERVEMIKSFTERHNKLLELGDKLQNIFSLTFLFSFVISSLVLCFIAFQLSTSKDMSIYSFYVPYLLMIAGQVLLLCFYGQKMVDSSQTVVNGVYNCGWENFGDESFKRQLILIMLRAQRAQKLTAMNFSDVTLESFTAVSLKFNKFTLKPHRKSCKSQTCFSI